ncbi:hypothetical protein U1Q18_029817 [Sarracenia purpurea var. burkii]
MTAGIRSQELNRMEDSIRGLRESSERHGSAIEAIKRLLASMNLNYDHIATKILNSPLENSEKSWTTYGGNRFHNQQTTRGSQSEECKVLQCTNKKKLVRKGSQGSLAQFYMMQVGQEPTNEN